MKSSMMPWALLVFAGCASGSPGLLTSRPNRSTPWIAPEWTMENAQEQYLVTNWDDGLSLEEALALGLAQNPRVQAIRREMELAQARRITAGQPPYNPVLSAGMQNTFPLISSGEYAARLGLSQEFEIAGQRDLRITIADVNIERTRAATANAERLLRADIATTFLENLNLDERVTIANRNVQVTEALLAVAEARFAAKQIPGVDVNLVRLQHQRTRNETARIVARRRDARKRLAALLGEPLRSEFMLDGKLEFEPLEIDRKTALRQAHESRSDLHAIAHLLEMAREQIQLEKALARPNPEVGAFYERESESLGGLTDRSDTVGVELRIPLPVLNVRKGEIAEARASVRILQAGYYERARQIERDVDLALSRLEIARETIGLYEQQLNQLSKTNLEEFEKAYRAGEVGTLEVLRAQEDFNRVAEGYQEALLEYLSAKVAVEAVIGAGVAE